MRVLLGTLNTLRFQAERAKFANEALNPLVSSDYFDGYHYCTYTKPKEEPTMRTYPQLFKACPTVSLYDKIVATLGDFILSPVDPNAKIQWLWEICCDHTYQSVGHAYYNVPRIVRSDVGSKHAPATTLYYKLLDAINRDLAPAVEPERRPFDLEAAKRGEAFETRWGTRGIKLLGVAHNGALAVEYPDGSYSFHDQGTFFMSPKPVEKVTLTRTLYLYRRKSTGSTFISEGQWPTCTAKLLGSKTFTITEGDTPDAE